MKTKEKQAQEIRERARKEVQAAKTKAAEKTKVERSFKGFSTESIASRTYKTYEDRMNMTQEDYNKNLQVCGEFYSSVAKGFIDRQKVMTEGNDTAGGYTVPDEVYNNILFALKEEAWLRNQVSRFEMQGDTLDVIIADGDATVTEKAENTEYTPSDLSFEDVSFTAIKSTVMVYATEELLDDWALTPSAADTITRNIATVLARRQDQQLIAGVGGAGKRTGLVSEFKAAGSQFNITSATNTLNMISFDQSQAWIDSLKPQYQAGGIIICRQDALKLLRKLATGVQGVHYWQNTFAATARPTQHIQQMGWFADKPVFVSVHLANNYTIGGVIDANKAGALIYLNPKYTLGLAVRNELKLSLSEHFQFNKDVIAFKGRNRFDCKILFGEACSVLAYKARN